MNTTTDLCLCLVVGAPCLACREKAKLPACTRCGKQKIDMRANGLCRACNDRVIYQTRYDEMMNVRRCGNCPSYDRRISHPASQNHYCWKCHCRLERGMKGCEERKVLNWWESIR